MEITLEQFKSVFEYIEDEGIAIKLNDDELKAEFMRFMDKRPSFEPTLIPEDKYPKKQPKMHTIFRCIFKNKHKASEKGYYTDKSGDYYYEKYCLVCGRGLGLPSLAGCYSPNEDLTTSPPSGGSGVEKSLGQMKKNEETKSRGCVTSTHDVSYLIGKYDAYNKIAEYFVSVERNQLNLVALRVQLSNFFFENGLKNINYRVGISNNDFIIEYLDNISKLAIVGLFNLNK